VGGRGGDEDRAAGGRQGVSERKLGPGRSGAPLPGAASRSRRMMARKLSTYACRIAPRRTQLGSQWQRLGMNARPVAPMVWQRRRRRRRRRRWWR
jgi:hypothetical protein